MKSSSPLFFLVAPLQVLFCLRKACDNVLHDKVEMQHKIFFDRKMQHKIIEQDEPKVTVLDLYLASG